jgi:antitoxin component YwqK of YwqJK toxin-antitoxin module
LTAQKQGAAEANSANRRLCTLALLLGALAVVAGGLGWWGYFNTPVEMVDRYTDGRVRKLVHSQRLRAAQIPQERWGTARPPASALDWYWVSEMTLFFPDGKVSERGPCRPFPARTGNLAKDLPREGVAKEGLWRGWHPQGSLAFEVMYRGGKREGPLLSWHKTGEPQDAGMFENDLKSGLWITKHANGQKHTECTFVAGQPHGMGRTWNEDGTLKSEQHFEHGVQTGRELILGGEFDRAERQWVAGKEHGLRKVVLGGRRTEEEVVYGKLHGYHRTFRTDGELLVEGQHVNDAKEGRWVDYFAGGQKQWEREYRSGLLHGPERRWRASGALESSGEYQNGKLHGKWIQYDASGLTAIEGEYAAGQRHGEWITHNEGEVVRRIHYNRGQVSTTKTQP